MTNEQLKEIAKKCICEPVSVATTEEAGEAIKMLMKQRDGLLKALECIANRNITYWSEDGEIRANFESMNKAMDAFRNAREAISIVVNAA